MQIVQQRTKLCLLRSQVLTLCANLIYNYFLSVRIYGILLCCILLHIVHARRWQKKKKIGCERDDCREWNWGCRTMEKLLDNNKSIGNFLLRFMLRRLQSNRTKWKRQTLIQNDAHQYIYTRLHACMHADRQSGKKEKRTEPNRARLFLSSTLDSFLFFFFVCCSRFVLFVIRRMYVHVQLAGIRLTRVYCVYMSICVCVCAAYMRWNFYLCAFDAVNLLRKKKRNETNLWKKLFPA